MAENDSTIDEVVTLDHERKNVVISAVVEIQALSKAIIKEVNSDSEDSDVVSTCLADRIDALTSVIAGAVEDLSESTSELASQINYLNRKGG